MDTISRENNSMLPVGGIIVGVIALLLGGYSAIKLSSVGKTLAAHEEKLAKVDALESQVSSTAATADKASRDLAALTRSTQDAFNQVGAELGNLRAGITKLEESAKAPAKSAKGGGAPAVAGPDEYIIKAGDTFAKIARAQGTTIDAMQQVNPGVDSRNLKIGQKIKLPKK
ncbi:MAG: LysM peptidoglycan-binding domain-containing protein [Opitutaceae bacterium]|nr:LysM peptidoglycan-binding domain-containing protein [Opitutaceae bacterium]